MIVGDLLHREAARVWRAHGDCHIGLALGQVDDPRQRENLNLEPGVLGLNGGADLWQKKIGAAVRCADADLAGEARRHPPPLVKGQPQRLFRLSCPLADAVAVIGQGIALRCLDEERRAQGILEPRYAAAHGGRIHLQKRCSG